MIRRHWFPKAYADAVARLRVTAGFVMVAAFAWFAHPDATSLGVGLAFSACGLALRAWAAGHLAKDQRLATSGPYSFTRNPLYLGTLITALGWRLQLAAWVWRCFFPDCLRWSICLPSNWKSST